MNIHSLCMLCIHSRYESGGVPGALPRTPLGASPQTPWGCFYSHVYRYHLQIQYTAYRYSGVGYVCLCMCIHRNFRKNTPFSSYGQTGGAISHIPIKQLCCFIETYIHTYILEEGRLRRPAALCGFQTYRSALINIQNF